MEVENVSYAVGDTVKLVGRQYGYFNPGDTATVTNIGPGIFPGDVYVSVIDPAGHKATGYHWRFEKT